jgi:hypothetical protein
VDEEARSLNARLMDDALRHEQRDLGGSADDLEKVPGSPPRIRPVAGDASAALLEAAQEGDGRRTLMAVVNRGLGAVRHMRLGSVSTRVEKAAQSPVLVHPVFAGRATGGLRALRELGERLARGHLLGRSDLAFQIGPTPHRKAASKSC